MDVDDAKDMKPPRARVMKHVEDPPRSPLLELEYLYAFRVPPGFRRRGK